MHLTKLMFGTYVKVSVTFNSQLLSNDKTKIKHFLMVSKAWLFTFNHGTQSCQIILVNKPS